MKNFLLSSLLVVVMGLICVSAHAARYEMIPLFDGYSVPLAMSETGEVVGRVLDGNGTFIGFVWLPAVPAQNGQVLTLPLRAYAVSPHAKLIAGGSSSTPVVWRRVKQNKQIGFNMSNLELPEGESADITAIAHDRRSIGGSLWHGLGDQNVTRAATWETASGKVRRIYGNDAVGARSTIYAFLDLRTAVGNRGDVSNVLPMRVDLFTGVLSDFARGKNTTRGTAYAAHHHEVVGEADDHAFWHTVAGEKKSRPPLDLNGNLTSSSARGINGKHHVVGKAGGFANGTHAYLWEIRPKGDYPYQFTPTDLNSAIDPNLLTANGGNWELTEAVGITNKGWIAATGRYTTMQASVPRAVVLVPTGN